MLRYALALTLAFTSLAHADTKLSVMGSLLFSNPEVDNFGSATVADEKSGTGFGLGMRALMGINDQLYLRSGASVVQKKFGYEIDEAGSNQNNDISLTYLNIPLTFYWKASPQVGLFGGTALNAKLSDSCDYSGTSNSCMKNKMKTLVFPAIIGFDFSFTEKIGMELSYEYGASETAKSLKVHSAIASFLYHLD
jgi:hypothetical protein